MIRVNGDLHAPSNVPDLYDAAKKNKMEEEPSEKSGEVDHFYNNTAAPHYASIPLENHQEPLYSVPFKDDKDNLSSKTSPTDILSILITHQDDSQTKSANQDNLRSAESDDQDYLTPTNTQNKKDLDNVRSTQFDNGNYLYPQQSHIAKDEENSRYINADYRFKLFN